MLLSTNWHNNTNLNSSDSVKSLVWFRLKPSSFHPADSFVVIAVVCCCCCFCTCDPSASSSSNRPLLQMAGAPSCSCSVLGLSVIWHFREETLPPSTSRYTFSGYKTSAVLRPRSDYTWFFRIQCSTRSEGCPVAAVSWTVLIRHFRDTSMAIKSSGQ